MVWNDKILAALYQEVRHLERPEDMPASTGDIAGKTGMPLEYVISLCQEMIEEGFLVMSTLHTPPLVYLTLTGLARMKRLQSAIEVPPLIRM